MPGLSLVLSRDERRQGRRVAVIASDWLYCYPPTGEVFLTPRGYETDFASIPGWAQILINPFGDHAEAAVIHDWLYAAGRAGGRDQADEIFRFAMAEQGVNPVKRNLMFQAVRLGGEAAYGREAEWRFVDPKSFKEIDAPIERSEAGSIAKINCDNLSKVADGLLTAHGTGPAEPGRPRFRLPFGLGRD